MCGIAGKVRFDGGPIDRDWLHAACDLLAHRGPDGEQLFLGGGGGRPAVGLGHRRLKVIDLAPTADQPMDNAGCRGAAASLFIVFNGEIYNYRELREELLARGHRFRTNSDTEAILHLYEEVGEACVERLRGMFALALWDAARERLLLARDRVGKKPLYYRHDGATVWFASEPRALIADPEVPADLNRQAIRGYLALGYVAGSGSAFAALRRLPPAHRAIVDRSGIRIDRYWSLEYTPKLTVTGDEAAERVLATLEESVRLRLISDVPLGAFLSGGVDSSAIVALMCRLAAGRVQTFSIGFDDARYSELPQARAMAARLGTEHHEYVVSPDLREILPRLAWHYGEPYADSSAVPTYHLARLARQRITVALNGDGGDESFAGYRRYTVQRLLRAASRLPRPLRAAASASLDVLPSARDARSRWYDLRRLLAAIDQAPARRQAGWFGFFDPDDDILEPEFRERTSAADALAPLTAAFEAARHLDPVDAAMAADVAVYLPDDLLVKVDIATMAFGLEGRSPLLDHELMSLAARLPASMKLRGTATKALLKRSIRGLVPADVLNRPKTGFAIPLDAWLREDLRDMAADVLFSRAAAERGCVRPGRVRQLFDEHMSGRASHGHRLWALLMLELWHEYAYAPARRRERTAPYRPAIPA